MEWGYPGCQRFLPLGSQQLWLWAREAGGKLLAAESEEPLAPRVERGTRDAMSAFSLMQMFYKKLIEILAMDLQSVHYEKRELILEAINQVRGSPQWTGA